MAGDPFLPVVRALSGRGVRFVVIGVWGANYYAPSAGALFTTLDRDLFLPLDAATLLSAWAACEASGLELLAGEGGDPLDRPRDAALAAQVVEHRATTRASDHAGLDVDLSLVMAGHEFDPVWEARRHFVVDGVDIPVARLEHIVASKAATGREKDRLFLATHAETLRRMGAGGPDGAGDRPETAT